MRRILVIDDQQDNIISIKAILKNRMPDSRIIAAYSGFEGIQLAFEKQPDVILLDIIMPELDGYETCNRLKQKEETKHIPVIMLTAIKTDSESRAKGLNLGADAFLSKPIDAIELIAQINVMFRIKRAEDKLRADKEILDSQVKERTAKLDASLQKMQSIYRIAPTGIGVVNNRVLIEVNQRACEMLGYSSNELIGKDSRIMYPSNEEYEFVGKEKYRQIDIKGSGIVETRWKRKDGIIIHVLLASTPFDTKDLTKGVIFTALDITERKKDEIKLKKQAVFVQQNPAPVFSFNNAGEILEFSKSTKRIFPQLKTGSSVFSYLKNLAKYSFEIIDKKGSIQIEEEINNVTYLITLKKDFETNAIYAFGSNISDIKRSELLQKVLYNISNAVTTTPNLSSLLRQIKNELEQIIDTTNFHVALYNPETDALSLPFYSNNAGDDTPAIPKSITLTRYLVTQNKSLLIDSEEIAKLRSEKKIRDSEKDPLIWLGVPLKIDGELSGVLAVQSYTNKNAYTESDLKMLEFVSDQISLSIHRKKREEDLEVAHKRAMESDRLKSAFLANMSHEIRTPMNGILGFSDLLKDPGLSGIQIQKYVGIIEKSGHRMLNIINDLIDVSKIESGQIELFYSDVDLKKQFEYLYSFFNLEANNKGIYLFYKFDLSESDSVINTDSEKLYAILTNLIKNAIKYTNEGSIEFGCNRETGKIEFYVKDTGVGIEKEKQQSVFHRFVQADQSLSSLYEGAGLGLSIAKSYIELMGGEISVESEIGKGSEFRFYLPAKALSKKETSPEIELKEADNAKSKRLKIIVAEDEETAREYLKIVLKNKETLFAGNGVEAIDLCRNNSDVDLILMDMKMPVMDGFQATKEIRKFNTEIKIIAQTAFSLSGDREKILQAGCNDYISKPIDRQKLKILINKYF